MQRLSGKCRGKIVQQPVEIFLSRHEAGGGRKMRMKFAKDPVESGRGRCKISVINRRLRIQRVIEKITRQGPVFHPEWPPDL